MKIVLTRCLIILIFLFGLFARLYQFPNFPEMHADEMGFSYSAYSWLKTGVDEYGRPPGVLLESLGDWKLALYGYVILPFVAWFGLEVWAVRLPSSLFGVLSIPLFYIVTQKMFQRRDVALIGALVVWILPWHIIFSRTGNEVMLELCLLLGGLYFFLRWLSEQRLSQIVLVGVCFGLCVLSYYPAFVTVPMVALALPFLYWQSSWRRVQVALVPFLVTLVVLVLFLATQPRDRISQTSFLSSEGPQSVLFDRVSESGFGQVPVLVTRAMHNKLTVGMYEFLTRYLAHFDWRFLLIDGEPGDSRYDLPYQGPLYLWMGVFLVWGGAVAINRLSGEEWRPFAVVWVILLSAMVPGAMTVESVNLQRSFLAVPALAWLVAIGLAEAWRLIRRMPRLGMFGVVGITLVVVCVQMAYFLLNYFVHHQYRRPWGRHAYVDELIKKVDEYSPNFSQTYIADIPYLPMLYYSKTDPKVAQEMLRSESYKRDSATVVKRFGKYAEMRVRCPQFGKPGVLYACKGSDVPEASRVVDVVRYRDNVPAYTLIELLPTDDPRVREPKPDRVTIKPETRGQPSITMDEGVIYR